MNGGMGIDEAPNIPFDSGLNPAECRFAVSHCSARSEPGVHLQPNADPRVTQNKGPCFPSCLADSSNRDERGDKEAGAGARLGRQGGAIPPLTPAIGISLCAMGGHIGNANPSSTTKISRLLREGETSSFSPSASTCHSLMSCSPLPRCYFLAVGADVASDRVSNRSAYAGKSSSWPSSKR